MRYLIFLLLLVGCVTQPKNNVSQLDLYMRVMQYCQFSSMHSHENESYSPYYRQCMGEWGY